MTQRNYFQRANRRAALQRRRMILELLEDRRLMAIDSQAGVGLLGQYYNNADLTSLAVVRTDPQINFNWGNSSPDSGIDPETFSVRWSGQIEAQYTEVYTFFLSADDGARLWINGQKILDRWNSSSSASATYNLVAGRRYDIIVEYREQTAAASITLEWSSPSQARQVIPSSRLFPAERGSLTRELWNNLPGSSVIDLTNQAAYPNSPSAVNSVATFESPSNVADNFGQRIRGYLHVPQSGDYTFFIAGDESAELRLSSSSDATQAVRIARVTSATAPRQWNLLPEQRSAVISLVAGSVYYIDALHKEASGADHLSIGWLRPGSSTIEVIPAEFLSPMLPEVSLFAVSPVTAEGSSEPATFQITREGSPLNNPLTVYYTLRGSATNGSDYNSLNGAATIPAGQKGVNISLTAIDDGTFESPESVVIELREGPGYNVGLTSQRTATATVQDNSPAPSGGTSLLTGNQLANFVGSYGATFSERTDATYGNVIRAQVPSNLSNPWDSILLQSISAPVNKGDIVFVEFWVRSVTPTGNVALLFERNSAPYNKSLSRGIGLSPTWVKIQTAFYVDANYAAGQAQLAFYLASQGQTVEFAQVLMRNYGPSSTLAPSDGLVVNNINGNFGTLTKVGVAGQSFRSADQLKTNVIPPNNETWRFQALGKNQAVVGSGERMRIEFWARSIAGASPTIGVNLQESFGNYTTLLYQQINPTSAWQRYTYEVVTSRAYSVEQLQTAFSVGFGLQTVEIGGFSWTNLTRGLPIEAFPSRSPVRSYGGRLGTDQWRDSANNRIVQNRMANLIVDVRDTNGSPIDGAVVSVRQNKHEFVFGSAISGYDDLLNPNGTDIAKRYQAEIKRLFNTAVVENNLKWPDFLNNRQLGIDAANWVASQGLKLRGHNVIWPSRTFMPNSVWAEYDRLAATDPSAARTYLRNTINARVQDVATTFANNSFEWDIVNEPFDNNDVMSILGNAELFTWFERFRTYAPSLRRTLNDYDIFSRNGQNTAHRNNFDYWLSELRSRNLIETIGEQSHYNEYNLTDIDVLASLIQTYSTYGIPIAITEFDVNTTNEQLQADYLRDYLTMTFSQPNINQFIQWGFWANQHWLPNAALYRSDFSIKPNGQAYEDLVFGEWWTDAYGTSRSGQYVTRGVLGNYDITVTRDGTTVSTTAALGANGTSLIVTLPGNTVPTSISLSSTRIAENSAAGTIVGLLTTVDSGTTNSFTYSLVSGAGSDDNAAFVINGNQLQTAASFDFEQRSAYRIRVRSSDQGGLATERSFVIQVGNSLETDGVATDLMIPLYQYPSFANANRTQLSGWWASVAAAANATQPITVVINPSSGPIDPNTTTLATDYQVYVDAIRLLRANPFIRILGYIPTGYGSRSQSQLSQFVNWYATGYKDSQGGSLIDGVFLDEVLATPAQDNYYRTLRNTIRGENRLAGSYIMANPGVLPESSVSYSEPLADSWVTYENTESPAAPATRLINSTVPSNAASSVDFVAIVHSVPNVTDLRRVARTIKSKGYGQLFVTNDVMNNPYDAIPSYWNDLLTELHRPWINASSFAVNENSPVGTVVGTVVARDPDPGQTLSYSIVAGNIGNAFSINNNGTITVSGSIDYETLSSYALTVRVTDNSGQALTDSQVVTVSVNNVPDSPPRITNVVFGDGSSQRSVIRSITVDFDTVVTLSSGAFLLEQRRFGSVNWTAPTATQLAIQVATQTFNGGTQTRATLTFSSTATTGAFTEFGSLVDGNYRLTVLASSVQANNLPLDGNNDGIGGDNFVRGAVAADNFFRLFGDSNGDGTVNSVDTAEFRKTFGLSLGAPAYNAAFDFDNNNTINTIDRDAYRRRTGVSRRF